MNELTVVLKDDERSYRQKFLIYHDYMANEDDPTVCECIDDARKNFAGEPETIQVKIHMEIVK